MSLEVFEGAIGIDLGTTYSCVAIYNETVEIIANEQGNRVTPSFVAFTKDERLVGDSAKNQAALNPKNTIYDVKRLIGRPFEDPDVQKDMKSWPFKVTNFNGNPQIDVEYLEEKKSFSPQEISSMILMKMKEIAETRLGKKVEKAVITVPAYFNDAQRQSTKDAGSIAGLNVLRIINEPTAAAIAYGLDAGKSANNKKILIFDLGGGTFDVSLLSISDGVFNVIATAGNPHLGGQDFDLNLLNYLMSDFEKKHGLNLSTDSRSIRRLMNACERAKRSLSSGSKTTIEIDSLFGGKDFSSIVTRAKFEDLNSSLFKLTLNTVDTVLKDAKVNKSDVDDIVLVGGSTRIPKIQQLLTEYFNGKALQKSINPDEAVAHGAAVQAAILTGQSTSNEIKDMLLLDVIPLSLGVATKGDVFATVVPRNTTIPTTKKRTFTTTFDYQTSVKFPVYQGERFICTENTLLGEFELNNIPSMPQGQPVLEAIFDVDADGILKVTAIERSTGVTSNITISNTFGRLSPEKIEKMISDAEKFKSTDDVFKIKLEQKQKLESYISTVDNSLLDPVLSSKFKKLDKEKIESALSDAMNVLELESSTSDDYKKAELSLKRLVNRCTKTR